MYCQTAGFFPNYITLFGSILRYSQFKIPVFKCAANLYGIVDQGRSSKDEGKEFPSKCG